MLWYFRYLYVCVCAHTCARVCVRATVREMCYVTLRLALPAISASLCTDHIHYNRPAHLSRSFGSRETQFSGTTVV
jgi:hypothetical protein